MSVRKRKRPPTANRWGDLPVRRDQAVLAVLTEQWTPAHAIELAVADDAAFRLDPSDKRAGNSLKRAVERCIARLVEERHVESRVRLVRNRATRMVRRRREALAIP